MPLAIHSKFHTSLTGFINWNKVLPDSSSREDMANLYNGPCKPTPPPSLCTNIYNHAFKCSFPAYLPPIIDSNAICFTQLVVATEVAKTNSIGPQLRTTKTGKGTLHAPYDFQLFCPRRCRLMRCMLTDDKSVSLVS